ncbi:sensor histidine kinase [Sandaracinus amylolyticus]|uniref:sensor histidine kinase n=1 Tax=Sandaracinus amylolyticus TaxID=927083 RepID=UPI001F2B47B8|nr:ATP-binding protein [Sandaracinus amylolyticus]UJR82359.1 Hypothetical protein I5071_44240 [Sandaracinus amylolyticus]
MTTSEQERAERIFREDYDRHLRRTDRPFAALMMLQWIAAVLIAWIASPLAWEGRESSVHAHLYAAVLLGGAITALPVALVVLQPGRATTRYVVACAQMLWSALLIHLTGGRIETHFHVFGSLAILAFYRDVTVLIPATIVVAADHFVRGALWPESVYGLSSPEWWRFLEHAGWVVFIDVFLVLNCLQGYRELRALALRQAQIEGQQEKLLRVERLAAVGQLAASVGHELRNPLAAVRNAHTFIAKKLAGHTELDPKVPTFLRIAEREIDASEKIIANLLDFSRPRTPQMTSCPLRELVDEAFDVVPHRDDVALVNEVPPDLPVPELDRDQFRQIVMNLVQNAAEAVPEDRRGSVVVGASGGGDVPWRIEVRDDGTGMPKDVMEKVFQPLFSTKTKGTGLGLAVVASLVERHGGTISVASEVGRGTTFTIELPAARAARAEAAE